MLLPTSFILGFRCLVITGPAEQSFIWLLWVLLSKFAFRQFWACTEHTFLFSPLPLLISLPLFSLLFSVQVSFPYSFFFAVMGLEPGSLAGSPLDTQLKVMAVTSPESTNYEKSIWKGQCSMMLSPTHY